MLRALVFATLLAGPPEGAAPASPGTVEALAAEVRAVPPSGVAPLVAGDPRFAALAPGEREALLRAVALDRRWHVAASAANVILGFGIGSLFEGDLRGLALTATDAVASGVILAALVQASTAWGGGSTSALDAAPFAVAVLVAGRIAGLVLPWTWNGRRHHALSGALGELPPPPRASLLVSPLVASATGRAAAGATLVLRF